MLKAVERINAAIRAGVPEKTVEELMNPDAQLPEVYPSAADLYQRELAALQQQSSEVDPPLTQLIPDLLRPFRHDHLTAQMGLNIPQSVTAGCLFHVRRVS